MKLSLVLVYSLCAVSVTSRHILWQRQETTALAPSPTEGAPDQTANPEPSETPAPAESSPAESSPAEASPAGSSPAEPATASSVSTRPESPRPTLAPSTFSLVPGSAPTLTTSAHKSNQTTTGDPVPLPLPPKLTPGVGLAGAVLMITGLAYGIIGIRNKWMYTFFGVAYLVSLAVLVLILYCMNPPVSDGVQGAYFVAVLLTSCLCGGVALVFRDLADGFGCLLGGFTVGMWFLTLKPGGIISNTVGKAVFLGTLTVAVGLTGLSHRTRRYGSIVSIPFSGATATILGVDCFSRAGMKEFWIYLWHLNVDAFPLETTTYPLTRGMKVEIAGIIILFVLGLLSQIKLAKVLKERKQKLFEKSSQKETSGATVPPTIGQRVSGMLQTDQGRYQSIYGDKSVSTLTVVPSSETLETKGFTVKERRISSVPDLEMATMRPTMVHRTTIPESEEEIERSPYLEPQDKRRSDASRSGRSRNSLPPGERGFLDPAGRHDSHVALVKEPLSPPAPEVVPLPFKIPSLEVSNAKSQGSLSAIEEDFMGQRRSVQRASNTSWKRSSNRMSVVEATTSREELMIPEDNDNASSVAATFDELDEDQMSLSAVTLPRSPIDDVFSLPSPRPSNRASIAASLGDGQLSPRLDVTFTDETGALDVRPKRASTHDEKRDSVNPSTVPLPRSEASDVAHSPLLSPTDSRLSFTPAGEESANALAPLNSAASKRSSAQSDAPKYAASDNSADKSSKLKIVVPQGPSQPLTQEILSEQVADGVSKITLRYRTNEWAKHLENAQEPEEDETSLPPSPGVQVDTMFRDTLEHTPLSPVVDPTQITVPKPVAKRSSTDPIAHQRKKSRSEALAKLTSSSTQVAPSAKRHSSTRNVSSPSQSRPGSTVMAWPGPAQRLSRNVSSPVPIQAIVEYPSEAQAADVRKGMQKRTSSSKKPMPETTLMVQRESKLESKPKSQSFAQSAPNLAVIPATPAASVHGKASPQDKIPPSGPKRQDSQVRNTSSSRQGAHTPQPIISHDLQNFNSHQPDRRNSTILAAHQQRRENMLTNWRESLREDQNPSKLPTQQKPSADEVQRVRLLNEKRQRQAARDQEQLAKAKKEERISSKMMNGGGNMLDAHRKAMLKMQNGVKH